MTTSGKISDIKPILCTYDPLEEPVAPSHNKNCICSYHAKAPEKFELKYKNSVRIDPDVFDLPWISSFCAGRQCKHWRAAEQGAKRLLTEISEFRKSCPARLPKGFRDVFDPDDLTPREKATIATATNAAIYMNAEASPTRIALVTRVYLLAWLQDDVVEFEIEHQYRTAVDEITSAWPDIIADPDMSISNNSHISYKFANELLQEDPVVGREVMDGLLECFLIKPRTEFSSLRDFLDHRAIDVGADFTLACCRFAYGIRLSTAEAAPLKKMIQLHHDHGMMVNDLYSYDKEKKDLQQHSAHITNTVYYLERMLSTPGHLAKKVCAELLWETEAEMRQEMDRLAASNSLTDNQRRCVYAMVNNLTGNVLYSLTSKRYGGARAREYPFEGKVRHLSVVSQSQDGGIVWGGFSSLLEFCRTAWSFLPQLLK